MIRRYSGTGLRLYVFAGELQVAITSPEPGGYKCKRSYPQIVAESEVQILVSHGR